MNTATNQTKFRDRDILIDPRGGSHWDNPLSMNYVYFTACSRSQMTNSRYCLFIWVPIQPTTDRLHIISPPLFAVIINDKSRFALRRQKPDKYTRQRGEKTFLPVKLPINNDECPPEWTDKSRPSYLITILCGRVTYGQKKELVSTTVCQFGQISPRSMAKCADSFSNLQLILTRVNRWHGGVECYMCFMVRTRAGHVQHNVHLCPYLCPRARDNWTYMVVLLCS